MKPIVILLCVMCLFQFCKKDPDATKLTATGKIVISNSNALVNVTDVNTTIMSASPALYQLDLNKDGSVDFIFKVNNSYGCASAVQDINLSIETANGSSYILSDSIYPSICHSSSGLNTTTPVNALYPKVLSMNDSIGVQSRWRQGHLPVLHSSRGACPPDGSYMQDGKWIGLDQKYIGLRCQNRLGWVKIGLPDNSTFRFYEFALSH